MESRESGNSSVCLVVLERCFIFGLYLYGLCCWYKIFGNGNCSFVTTDWTFHAKFTSVLKDAVLAWEVPFYSVESIQLTNKIIADPRVLLSPQVLLLRYLEIEQFYYVNICIMYSICFIGLLKIRKFYELSIIPFFILYSLVSFNGYVIGHVAGGHAEWIGYFFLPLLVYYFLKLLEEEEDAYSYSIKIALVLFCMYLQGAIHLCNFVIYFMGVYSLFSLRHFGPIFVSLVTAFFLSAIRFFPVLVSFGNNHPFDALQGWPSFHTVIEAFCVIRPFDYSPLIPHSVHWSEYNYYLGVLGFAFITYFGIYKAFPRNRNDWGIDSKTVVLFFITLFLSFAYIWKKTFFNIDFILFTTERVPSRFLIVPLLFILVIAVRNLQSYFSSHRFKEYFPVYAIVGLMALVNERSLQGHLHLWSLPQIGCAKVDGYSSYSKGLLLVTSEIEPSYFYGTCAGAIMTVIMLGLAIGVLIKKPDFMRRRVKV